MDVEPYFMDYVNPVAAYSRRIKMKKLLAMFTIVVMMFYLTACNNTNENQEASSHKLTIVASLFPQYDFTRQIVGDKADVKLLLPPGIESHTFDPRPSDISSIYNADMFIYTSKYMEPWAEKVVEGVSNKNLLVIDASNGISLVKEEHDHDEHKGDHKEDHHDEDEHQHEYDSHIWLDLTLAMKMVDNIVVGLCEKDARNAEFYRKNADNYKKELQKLDDDIFRVVKSGKRDTLVFGGRFAYSYFLNRYSLKYESAYDSCSTEGEPSVQAITSIIDYIKKNNIPCIYHEEFVEPKVAKSIAHQTGISSELFSTAHNLSKDQLEDKITYINIMRENLKSIKKGLN